MRWNPLSKRALAANLERETQARIKAEKHLEDQSEYMNSLPFWSDVQSAEGDREHLLSAFAAIARGDSFCDASDPVEIAKAMLDYYGVKDAANPFGQETR